VKNQYFGDKRDLLKFSLLESLAQGLNDVSQLTCVWLLTPPSPNNDGNRHFRENESGSRLASFLRDCIATGRRDVRELAKYMASRPETYFSFGDEPAQYFTSSSRATYFESIPGSALRSAVVFFDPDNGLEPGTTVSAAHLKYSELRSVFNRMDDASIAVVYQHLPRIHADRFWPKTAERLRTALNCSAGFVASGHVGFLIAARDETVARQVNGILQLFHATWPNRLRIADCVTALT
jgi:hypothetical protein